MGGVAHSIEIESIANSTAFKGNIINIWSEKDEVLGKLFLSTLNNFSPCGLKEIHSPKISNIDLSSENIGHLGYEQNHNLIIKKIKQLQKKK